MSSMQPEALQQLPPIVQFLVAAGQAAPSADNSQPWRFHWHDGRLTLYFQPDEIAAEVFGGDRHCEHLTMGAVTENLLQAARHAGLDIDWKQNSNGPDYLSGNIDPETPAPDAARDHPLFKRHTNRLAYRNTPVDTEILDELAVMSEDDCRLLLFSEARRISEVASLIDMGSRLRFRTREVHEWFAHVLRFSAEEVASGTGLDVATIDLPPGGRMLLRLIKDWRRMSLLNRIGAYKALSKIESSKMANSSAVVAVIGPSDDRSELAAGRLTERIWTFLNERGLAVQPFYVITDLLHRLAAQRTPSELIEDASKLRDRTNEMLPEGLSLHMLLRIGHPKKIPTRSMRLSPGSVCQTKPPAR